MPIIKHSAIHVTPMKAIKYVINGDKTDECKYVTGINVSENAKDAFEDFRLNFEMHTGERFNKLSLPENGRKSKIRLHHYIQSFKPGEVTPEMANEIGERWARMFLGDASYSNIRYQVLVCTHIDKQHIHNHILISAMDLDGKMLYDNKKTLNRAREKSDDIAKRYGLSIIENPKKGTMLSYTEYIAREKKTSWKYKLKRKIDMLVLLPDVKSITDLVEKLNQMGYVTTTDKYLHVKRAADKKKNFMSTLKLGDGYGTEELQYRIENKNVIMPLEKVNGYQGIQREYAFCLRETQFLLFRKKKSDYNVTYSAVRKSSDLLFYLDKHNIHSVQDFENAVNSADEKYKKLLERKKRIEDEISDAQKVFVTESGKSLDEYFDLYKQTPWTSRIYKFVKENYQPLAENRIISRDDLEKFRERYSDTKSELDKINREIELAAAERKEAADNYKAYLEIRETDYDQILREMKEFYEFSDNGITENYKGDLTEIRYFSEMHKGSVTDDTYFDRDRLLRAYNAKYGLSDDEPNRNTNKNRSWER